jgi:hypothetical protein
MLAIKSRRGVGLNMETAICMQATQSLFGTLVKPAILAVLSDGQGFYRCERDLHHHLTVCLDRIQPLQLGSRQPVLHTEKPAIACYGSGRHGNIDFFVADASYCADSQSGVAIEVNWNYNDPFKAQRDLCKLLDPKNAYAEPVYFAYGRCQELLTSVQAGLERAFTVFVEAEPGFLLPAGLRIIVAVRQRHRELVIHSTVVDEPCTPSQLFWSDLRGENWVAQSNRAGQRIGEHLTVREDKMTHLNEQPQHTSNRNPIDNLPVDSHSYQTVPLSLYSGGNQQTAKDLYVKITQLGARTRRYKGSYSIFGIALPETVAKIVIYEDGKGKTNGGLHLRHGVYVLIRANGTVGERNRATLSENGLLVTLLSSETIGIAPAHGERFHYLRVDETNVYQCLELLRVCALA